MLLPRSKTNQYVANVLLSELGLFQKVEPDEFGDYLLHQTFPCYTGNMVMTNSVEYKQVNLAECARRISFAKFLDTFKNEGTFAQRLIVQIATALIDLHQVFAIYQHDGDDLAFTIFTHSGHESPDQIVSRLGNKHYFVFRTNSRNWVDSI